jgi:hypothetical protein
LAKGATIRDNSIILYLTSIAIKRNEKIIKNKFKMIFIVLLSLNFEDKREIIMLKMAENIMGTAGASRADTIAIAK